MSVLKPILVCLAIMCLQTFSNAALFCAAGIPFTASYLQYKGNWSLTLGHTQNLYSYHTNITCLSSDVPKNLFPTKYSCL